MDEEGGSSGSQHCSGSPDAFAHDHDTLPLALSHPHHAIFPSTTISTACSHPHDATIPQVLTRCILVAKIHTFSFVFSIYSTSVAFVKDLLCPWHYFSCWTYGIKQNQKTPHLDEADSFVGIQTKFVYIIIYCNSIHNYFKTRCFNMLSQFL